MAVLVLVILAAGALLWWARRRGWALPGGPPQRRLRVLERLALPRGAALLVVDYEGRLLLIGQAGERLSLLDSAPAAGSRAN